MPITPVQKRVARKQTPYERFHGSFPDYTQRMIELRQGFLRECQRLERLNRRGQRNAIRMLLRNRQFYEVFAFDALKRCEEFEHATPTTVESLAGQFDPFEELGDEPVLIRNVGMSDYRTRNVFDFGPKRRMHQQVIARILRHTHPPLESQKLFNGGMPKALSAIEAAISDGATHAMEVDFVNFYGTVRFDDLAEVMRPLPQAVTTHIVWDDRMRVGDLFPNVLSASMHATPEIPEGLPPGSSTSPIVGEALIARLLEAAQLPGIITYADNLCILGCSEEEVLERFRKLREAVRSPPFDCISGLSLSDAEVRNIVEHDRPSKFGIEFAKHESISEPGGTVILGWKPSIKKLQEFQISASDYVSIAQLNRAITKVRSRARYYPNWADGERMEAELVAALKCRKFRLQKSNGSLNDAVNAVVTAFVLWEGERPYSDFLDDSHIGLERAIERRLDSLLLAAEAPNRRPRVSVN